MSEMPENVAILLAVLVAANVVLVIVAVWRAWIQRRRTTGLVTLARDGGQPTGASAGQRTATTAVPVFAPGPPTQRSDPLTGMLLPAEWTRIVADEDARVHRYGRPATVVLIELDGLDRLVSVLGPDAANRILPAVADTLSRQARGADHVARLGTGRFGVLLPETGEVEAVNYVERVRAACELWLESGAIALRLAIGWASPAADTSLVDAFVEAQERMFAELRRGARRAPDVPADGAQPASELGGAPSAA